MKHERKKTDAKKRHGEAERAKVKGGRKGGEVQRERGKEREGGRGAVEWSAKEKLIARSPTCPVDYSRLSVVFGSVSSSCSTACCLPWLSPLASCAGSTSYLLSSCMLLACKPASGVGGAIWDEAEVA